MNLSYGQRKLLEIGRAMAMEANIYLFDEPFAGLFPEMVEKVKDIMNRMRETGRYHHLYFSQYGHSCASFPITSSFSTAAACSRRERWKTS